MSLNRDTLAQAAPKLARLTETVLFGEIWQGDTLTPRDRSLITVAALVALNRVEQLPDHLALAKRNGLTEEELTEAMTHLAFYAGWPAAVSGLSRLHSQPHNQSQARPHNQE